MNEQRSCFLHGGAFPSAVETKAKGELGGECARQACSNPAENYYHDALRWYYCKGCALRINSEAGINLVRPRSAVKASPSRGICYKHCWGAPVMQPGHDDDPCPYCTGELPEKS